MKKNRRRDPMTGNEQTRDKIFGIFLPETKKETRNQSPREWKRLSSFHVTHGSCQGI
jgi:hypothetical protein